MAERETESASWGTPREMNELEATMWRAGKHPESSTQGAVMEVLDGTPAWSDVRQLHIDGLQTYTRFRQRVVEPALPVGPPAWVDDEDFDLDNHLSRVRLSGPGTTRQLLDVARDLVMIELDRTRPPWTATFVEGLEGGGSAYVIVVHHSLMDGHGSVQLLSDLHSRSRSDAPGNAEFRRTSRTDPLRLAVDQAVSRALGVPKFAGRAVSEVIGAVHRGPLEAARFVSSAGRVATPPVSEAAELLKGGSRARWRFEVMDCSLADLKAAGKAAGGTINDAYIAGIIGGLRIYHEKRGKDIGDITINMPVSLRKAGDPQGGNKFVTAFLQAPSSVADPAQRIARLREIVSRHSAEPALDMFGVLLPVMNRAPSAVLAPLFNNLQTRTDLTISNVPGMKSQVKFAGAAVTGIYYLAPLPGCAVMSVLFSYNGVCNIGINCDEELFGTGGELLECLQAGMDEVLDLRHSAQPKS